MAFGTILVTPTLRRVKRAAFSLAQRLQVLDACAASEWRRTRLVILCYHGVSLADEHEWHPGLYMRPSFFRSRMELLRRTGCNVVGLQEALDRLANGSLPFRSVVLTFDDGAYDFYAVAWPILQNFGYPASVYWTTYYAERLFPVFSVAQDYARWKSGRAFPSLPEGLADDSGATKDEWLRAACKAGGVPYELFNEQRLLTIMRPQEVAELAAAGCDFQLHTHRHRMPLEESAFRAEIRQNREVIEATTGTTPKHFCYTSGQFRGRFLPWLEKEGVESATTCEPGLTSPGTPKLLIPRLVDHEGLSEAEFHAWTSGVAALLPHRTHWKDPDAIALP